MTDNAIHLENLKKSYGSVSVIPSLSAVIEGGKFTVILGPSGCGKSTLLNTIAGLEAISGGKIRIGPKEVHGLAPKDRGCAMVFQNYALYPHMSVRKNIGYALKVAGVPRAERDRRVEEAADVVELAQFLDRRPSELSGGQRQRVAIARAIVREPAVLLFDEPLSNLDAKLRHGMRMELASLHDRIGATSVFVTHDQVEAMTLADKIMLLNKGQIEQYGTPSEIYDEPASTFVATFIGSPAMNLIDVTGRDGRLHIGDGTAVARASFDGQVTLGIRPEAIKFAETGIPVTTVYSEDLGSHSVVVVRLPDGQEMRLATSHGSRQAIPDRFSVAFPDDALRFFNSDSGKRIMPPRTKETT